MKYKYLSSTILWLTFFSIAMAFLESSVVVYLRALYYPDGFDFPLKTIDENIALTEVLREFATLIMLLGAGIIAGKNFSQRFAYFIYIFAIWDIFYYAFLKLLLDWPASFLTWDILFLIPVAWIGPVIAPIILSILMISLALIILYFDEKLQNVKIKKTEWLLLVIGSIIAIVSFTIDYCSFVIQNSAISEIWSLPSREKLFDLSLQYIPQSFSWLIFIFSLIFILSGIIHFIFRNFNLLKK